MAIRDTIVKLASDLENVDVGIISSTLDVMTDSKQDLELAAKICNDKAFIDPQWQLLGGRILVQNIKKIVPDKFSLAMQRLSDVLDASFLNFVVENADRLDAMVVPERDLTRDYFAISTLIESYLLKIMSGKEKIICETPQYLYLRVATFLWYRESGINFGKIKKVYDSLSRGEYSHATPTLFNSGIKKPQLASCFLSTIPDDMSEISTSWKNAAIISKNSGGLGFDYSQLRHSGIGHNGFSKGIIPWLRIKNEILCAVDQGGKRKGSGTVFLRDWHIDVEAFILARDETVQDLSAPDLFYSIMISDLFMNRVQNDEYWTLMCPNKATGLVNTWGAEFEKLYLEYEQENLAFSKKVKARHLFENIINIQIKKGMPFICYIDSVNRKNNQKHDGMIRCLNLCMEIGENTGINSQGQNEIASCILASECVASCVLDITDEMYNKEPDRYYRLGNKAFDFEKLQNNVGQLVENLNMVIDYNYYPENIPEIKYANLRNRPLAIGVQGLADAFALMDIPWVQENPNPDPKYSHLWQNNYIENEHAARLNQLIFENMYYAAVETSVKLALIHGPYDSFQGSELSLGKFHFELDGYPSFPLTLDWESLRAQVQKYGVRNALFIGLMPTASSAQILGNNESFEPFNSNIYTRTVQSGQFLIINKHLTRDLKQIGLWNTDIVKNIISNNGSIQNVDLDTIPENVRKRFSFLQLKYRTIFEIPQKILSSYCQDRGYFVDQSQSFNNHMKSPTSNKLYSFHFDAWKRGLKTGMYYLRQPPTVDAINFSLDTISIPRKKKYICTDTVCTACQS